jgi:endonuclease/exonuclease/phosphatase family metal-dependent hydrolase
VNDHETRNGRRFVGKLSALALASTLPILAVPPAADASTPRPAPLTNVQATANDSSSFTVTLDAAANTASYIVYAGATRHAVGSRQLGSAPYSSSSDEPQITVSGVPYRNDPYYYRVEAVNGDRHRYSDILPVGLQPPAPTDMAAHASDTSAYLTWDNSAAPATTVEQSTSSSFDDARTYKVNGSTKAFTPYRVAKGQRYFWRVRSVNAGTPSGWSPAVSAVAPNHGHGLRVMTYNVLEASHDGSRESGRRIAPWSKRKVVAARLIRSASPEVVAVQEAASRIRPHLLQVTSLKRQLGHKWAMARTQPPLGTPGTRSTVFLLYRKDLVTPYGHAGNWSLSHRGYRRFAAYQPFKVDSSGTKFLMVTPHLAHGLGHRYDVERRAETKTLIDKSQKYANKLDVSTVFAGDFNSSTSRSRTFDAATNTMRKHGIADAYTVAQRRVNARYDSGNQYRRTPIKRGESIDHIFATPGVGIKSWRLVMHLHHGHFTGVMASDHSPVLSTVILPSPASPTILGTVLHKVPRGLG